LLPQKNRRYAESCADFLKKAESKCYVSSSVKETILALLNDAYDWIVKDIQRSLFPYMKKEDVTKVTCRDGLAFEQFFDEHRQELQRLGSPYIYYEILGQVEHWTVSQVHSIPRGSSINRQNFLANIIFEVSRIYERLRSPIEAIDGKQVNPSAEVISTLRLLEIRKAEDIVHLASAIEYQFGNNIWVVFVTFDERHILAHKKSLFDVCALRCSKPVYAMEYLEMSSRMNKPIQYFVNIAEYTPKQIIFADAIEQSLHIKIIPQKNSKTQTSD
jgi:hypothetical protein